MRTALLSSPVCQEHHIAGHAESRQRLEAIEQALLATDLPGRLVRLDAPPATVAQVSAVHDRAYVERVQAIAEAGGGFLDSDTGIARGSYRAALAAAGCAVHGVDQILAGAVEAGFALVRPPGHHACRARGMGFCLFNNIAIAAQHALDAHHLERVLIVDFDAHHGNGTQEAFYASPQVLYLSTHLSPFYPGTGQVRETGTGAGEGFTVNVPLPYYCGDEGFKRAYDEVLVPLAERYQPQMILVSAGYDIHWDDPLTELGVSMSGIVHVVGVLTALARRLCRGRLLFVLEGGYRRRVLAAGVPATLRLLLGDAETEIEDPLGPYDSQPADVSALLARVKQIHKL